jgi:hypothetical protein
VNRQKSILRIVNTTEHVFKLKALDLSIELLLIAENFFAIALFVRLLCQLNECAGVACKRIQLLPGINPLLVGADNLKNLLCCNVVIPEVLLVRPGLEVFEIDEFLVEVKDTPSATQVACSVQPAYPSDLQTWSDPDRFFNFNFHPEESGAEGFPLCVALQRFRSTSAQGAVEQEIERPDVGHLKAFDRAECDTFEVLLHTLSSNVPSDERIISFLKSDEPNVRRVSLVAGPGVTNLLQLYLHAFTLC